MKKEFVIRGQTDSGETEVLNFSGYKPGYAYKMTEFQLYGSQAIASGDYEILGTVTAGKTGIDPSNVNFNDQGLIASSFNKMPSHPSYGVSNYSIINDTFLITQNLILMVFDSNSNPINWQCRFESVKMTGPEEAATNFKQFSISDE